MFSFAEAVVGLALSMCFFVVSGVPILCEKSTDKKRKNEENNCYVQMNNLKNELFNHYKAYGDCIINPEYSNPRIVYRIRETIRMGHADSPQEAIDILSKKAGVPIPTNYYPQTIHSGVVNYYVLFLPGNYFDK